jgi:hypothetical protein
MLTCACGARFEVDDNLAGQEVACPECQTPVKVPARDATPRRTSGYALASLVLALMGAFTPFTAVALALGIIGLVHVARYKDRLTGAGFAVAGIVLSLVFGGLTLFAFSSGELFGLGGWVRGRTLAPYVQTDGPLEITDAAGGFSITRPSEKWGRIDPNHVDDPVVSRFHEPNALMLVHPGEFAFLDVHSIREDKPLMVVADDILAAFHPPRRQVGRFPFQEDDDDFLLPARATLKQKTVLPEKDGVEQCEMELDLRYLHQQWHYIIRLYRQHGQGVVYVARGYTRSSRFNQVEDQLRRALDSFRILR